MDTEQEKQCTKCQQMKPLSEFGFDSQRQIYRAHCKICCSEYAKQYRESGPQGKTTKFFVSETEKQCTQCLQIKPLARFQIRPDRGNRYNAECRDCVNMLSPIVKTKIEQL